MSLLRYSLSTSVFPVPASPEGGPDGTVDLTITGTNPGSTAVSITSVAITIPYGSAASQLTPVQASTPTPPDGWTVSAQDTGSDGSGTMVFTFTPTTSPASVAGTALAFTFSGLTVNEQSGSVEISITENGTDPGLPRLYLAKFPSGWGDISFTSDPSPPIVAYGSGVTLSWSGPAQATYQLNFYTPQLGLVNLPGGGPALTATGSYPGSGDAPLVLTQDTTFYLTVTDNQNGQNNAQIELTATMELPPPEILQFSASLTLNSDGQGWTIAFTWITQYGASVGISGVAGSLPLEASNYAVAVTPSTIQPSYTLTVTSGELVATATIALQIGHFASITAPEDLNPGNLATAIAVNADGSLIAVGCDEGVLLFQSSSFTTATSVQLLSLSAGPPIDLAFVANDSLLFILGSAPNDNTAGTLTAFGAPVSGSTSWTQVASTSEVLAAVGMAVAGDGSWVVVRSQYSAYTVFSFSPQTGFSLVAVNIVPPGFGASPSNTFGTYQEQEVFFCRLNGNAGWANQAFSVPTVPLSPFVAGASLSAPPLPFTSALSSGYFRTYPTSPVLLQTSAYGGPYQLTVNAVLCDATTFAGTTNQISITSTSSSQTKTPPCAIGMNPLIFYAVTSNYNIGVFGPSSYTPTPPT